VTTPDGSPAARDFAGYLERYPRELAFGDEDPADVFDRYHAPGYVLTNDGLPLDRERLLAHVRATRRRVTGVSTSIKDLVVAGERVAARYVLTAVMRKGPVIPTEILTFGRLASDGRLVSAVQLTRALPTGPDQGQSPPS
jgi:hypothetical protein